MYRRPSKKQLIARRVAVSSVMTVAVIVIVTGIILFILGYRVDSDKGRLEQGALLQFDSLPTGANVSVDGVTISARTPGKQTVLAGAHTIQFSKDGYRTWVKSLEFSAGTLNWLDYARLVPNELTPQPVASYDVLASVKASPDQKSILVQPKADAPTFQLLDIRAQNVKITDLSIPSSAYSDAVTPGVTHTFAPMQWDSGGRYITVKHTYNQSVEWLVFDTQNTADTRNITRQLSIHLSDVRFAGTNGKVLFGLSTDGLVRKLDLGAATLSRALITNVETFDLFETNIITYVGRDANDTSKRVAGVYRDADEASHVLRTAATLDVPLNIATTRYYGDTYVAISEGSDVTVLKGAYPTSSNDSVSSLAELATILADGNVTNLSFSSEGDFLVARSEASFQSFEIDYQRQTTAALITGSDQPLRWLDPAYLWSVDNGMLTIREFDGANSNEIMKAEAGFDATLNENGRYLYATGLNDGVYTIQRVQMIVD